MKLATFDLEVAKDFDGDWSKSAPLGITCAALALSDAGEPRYFHASPQLSREQCRELVAELQRVTREGYTLVTWNGTAFDFAVLAQESEMPRECAELALAHVDLMAIVTFKRGHFLSLQKALEGAGISGKKKEVLLKDGSRLDGMSGKLAPQLWARGEFDAVLSYLREDVMPLLELARIVSETKTIRWTSGKGYPQTLRVERLWSVRECFAFPLPDTAWMNADPPQREKLIEWMPPLDAILPSAPYAPRDLRELPLFAYAAEDAYWREFRRALKT
ncbi:MAG: ribonuclease H-like domain-containing protein [Anaerolineales bacterium]|nr:ribonuclease H-like domain-containing protein [Anaerolineales bacterium]